MGRAVGCGRSLEAGDSFNRESLRQWRKHHKSCILSSIIWEEDTPCLRSAVGCGGQRNRRRLPNAPIVAPCQQAKLRSPIATFLSFQALYLEESVEMRSQLSSTDSWLAYSISPRPFNCVVTLSFGGIWPLAILRSW